MIRFDPADRKKPRIINIEGKHLMYDFTLWLHRIIGRVISQEVKVQWPRLNGAPDGCYTPAWISGNLDLKLSRSGGRIWVAIGCNYKIQRKQFVIALIEFVLMAPLGVSMRVYLMKDTMINKNIERHSVHTIVSWPDHKQWHMGHTSGLMMVINTRILTTIIRKMGKLNTHSPLYRTKDNWKN